jgi:hypothetical protein
MKTLAIAWSISVLSIMGCSADGDDCAGGACGPVGADDGAGEEGQALEPGIAAPTCEALCAWLDFDCGVVGEEVCIESCGQGQFDRAEMLCMARTCAGWGSKLCHGDQDDRLDPPSFDPRDF